MNINIYTLISLFAGLILGLLYFSGLWLTVKNMQKSRSPVALTLVSFFLRTAAVMLVLIFVARQGNYINIIVLLAGFIFGRFI
ncbi:MAG: hypothetical protein KAH35_07375, partial [Candidatus Atribacteria bacterium]|nr:hypothetical protein [Candidatus Atribacteria bacterium]